MYKALQIESKVRFVSILNEEKLIYLQSFLVCKWKFGLDFNYQTFLNFR